MREPQRARGLILAGSHNTGFDRRAPEFGPRRGTTNMPASAPSYAESYGARVANFFRGASSPRRDPERRQKGGRYDASRSPPLADTCPPPLDNVNTRSPPLDATVYGGRSRGWSTEVSTSCTAADVLSLDGSCDGDVSSSRVRFDQSRNTIHEAAEPIGDPALLWWTAAERRGQLARTEWVVALETKRRLHGEPRDPIPGESRRGLGIACEPSTPYIRAEKIALHRRGVLAAVAVADGDDVAHLAASLSAQAVAVARQLGDADHAAATGEAPKHHAAVACVTPRPESPLSRLQRIDSLACLNLEDSVRLAKGRKGGIAGALLEEADPYELASDLARSAPSSVAGSWESTRSWQEADAMDATCYGSSPESF